MGETPREAEAESRSPQLERKVVLITLSRQGKEAPGRSGGRVSGSRQAPLGGEPAEGAPLPTSTEDSSWAAATLTPGSNPANYQPQVSFAFYETAHTGGKSFPLKKKSRWIGGEKAHTSTY